MTLHACVTLLCVVSLVCNQIVTYKWSSCHSTRDMLHSCVTLLCVVSLVCTQLVIYKWSSSHLQVIHVTCRIHVCDMAHLCVWHGAFIFVTWCIHICDMTCCICLYIGGRKGIGLWRDQPGTCCYVEGNTRVCVRVCECELLFLHLYMLNSLVSMCVKFYFFFYTYICIYMYMWKITQELAV